MAPSTRPKLSLSAERGLNFSDSAHSVNSLQAGVLLVSQNDVIAPVRPVPWLDALGEKR